MKIDYTKEAIEYFRKINGQYDCITETWTFNIMHYDGLLKTLGEHYDNIKNIKNEEFPVKKAILIDSTLNDVFDDTSPKSTSSSETSSTSGKRKLNFNKSKAKKSKFVCDETDTLSESD